ncbi:TPA: type VI secretion system tip protein VgrG, partial [Enterobacter cloacae]|nr:type VI secretion system tip protein VgrG [Enterobacter cloacae subsp. cloacae]HCT8372107.1 type VI secretion system tip protein VgrG [Enterobacter cloacae]HDT6537188.1 type VI secretion system tip protein VgrG [Enterobacter cloacae]
AATQMGFMSRTKDGSVDNANALRFEDKAGAEQVWLQAERNLDINVKNDESHATEKNRTQFVGEDETLRVAKNQKAGVKGDVVCLTGNSRSDKVVNNFIISAGNTLRLECGESAIELSKDGSVNIIGNNFNFTAKQSAQINTLSGELHLNPADGSNAINAPGASHQTAIQQEVDGFFVFNANK